MGVCDSRQLVTGTTCREDRLAEIEAAKKFAVIDTYVMYVQKDHVTLDTVPQKEVVPRSWPCLLLRAITGSSRDVRSLHDRPPAHAAGDAALC